MPHRLPKLLSCAAAALIAWLILPGTFIDRGLFSLTARSFADPPFFITGKGNHQSGLTLQPMSSLAQQPSDPLIDIAITDDPDRVFQATPPSPVDIAIILKNLRRLGRDSVAIGTPLSWPEPDAISLMALDQQLDALPSVVTSAPLSRGAIPSPLPPAFRRASVAISKIHGNSRNLPIVNRISIPDVILGSTSSLAGFTLLESEPPGESPHLLARWDDRVVLSFPLLAALADHKISPEVIEIRLGKSISLGTNGPHIPIDEHGRLAIKIPPTAATSPIPAETLIDAPDNFLAENRKGTVLIRNAMLAAEADSLRFSESLVTIASLLTDPAGNSTAQTFNRIPRAAELLLLASLICLLQWLGHFTKAGERRALLALAALALILHFILVPATRTWPPTLPALAALLVAIPFNTRRHSASTKRKSDQPRITAKPQPASPPTSPSEIKSLPTPPTPAKKSAKKTPRKKTKKAPAKKTPRKNHGR